jgi:hypothetical protein
VAGSFGVGLVPSAAGKYASDLVKLIRLQGQNPTKYVSPYMAHRGPAATPQAKKLVNHVLEVLQQQ